MVIAVGLVIAPVIIPASTVVAPAALTVGATGGATGASAAAAVSGVATAAGGGGAAAIVEAAVASVATGAAGAGSAGAAVAATTQVATSAVVAESAVATGAAGGVLTGIGPVGWIVLGKSEYSWTCWKKVIHDESDKNEGVPLCYIFEHENVKSVSDCGDHYTVENKWGESFNIYFVKLPNGEMAAHAE